ncbi:unnamed protein product [Sphenostylis stenocarpa]|uniref:Uncharacterized protein n=1 Tax=Sphenostylis stenocarpa TaxID=92480 RepID=A0AA86SAB7_9FABA|nr:unnamed protein product [Sphenostylis stenocarpa]
MLPGRFSFFGGGDSRVVDNANSPPKGEEPPAVVPPTLKLETDRQVYRPGDPVVVTIQISNPANGYSFLMERLGFEIRGIEKLDTQWFATQKPLHGSKQRRGSLILNKLRLGIVNVISEPDNSLPSQSENVKSFLKALDAVGLPRFEISDLEKGSMKAVVDYVVRTQLPSIIPPSYKGSNIRYLYYVKSAVTGGWIIFENGQSRADSKNDVTDLFFGDVKPKTVMSLYLAIKLLGELVHVHHTLLEPIYIVPLTTTQLDIFWKEMDGDADWLDYNLMKHTNHNDMDMEIEEMWVRANDMYDGVEEGYDSSRDDISSVSSYNAMKESLYRGFGSSLSLGSSSARSLTRDASTLEGFRTSLSSNLALPRLSVAEVLSDSGADVLSSQKSFAIVSPNEKQKLQKTFSAQEDMGVSSSPEAGAVESFSSEGFIRGRSYNIRLDDQVLLKFSPKNSDSTYYFSDMIGGTLTFFHEEGARRCLEISITLETSETINRRFVHPSRRNSPTITKVQSDHHEVVADLLQTSFLFSIPMDGPMSFSTQHVSVQWVLRFEFFTTPKHVDWRKYDHPLLIEAREKTEWILPITVHPPPPRAPASGTRNEKLFSLDPMWVHT